MTLQCNILNTKYFSKQENKNVLLSVPRERTGGCFPEEDQHDQVHDDNTDYRHQERGDEEAHMESS